MLNTKLISIVILSGLFILTGCFKTPTAPVEMAEEFDPMDFGVKVPPVEDALKTLVQGHPRLVANAGDFQRVKKVIQTDEFAAKWYARLKADADQMLDDPVNVYNIYDGRRLLRICRDVLKKSSTWSLVYHIEGDKKYLDRLWIELQAAGNFKDWNPGHFLDVGEMSLALAIGYDWLYDSWSESQREFLSNAIRDKALNVVLDIGYGNAQAWFAKRTNNWNQVCNGGLLAGALAIADREPEIAAKIVHESVKSLPIAVSQYAPDGGCEEGPGYWAYGTSFNVVAVSVLESALGTSFGLEDMDGFDKAVMFPVYMASPTNYNFNFSDCHYGMINSVAMPWFASRFDLPVAMDYFRRVMAAKDMGLGRLSALGLFWYNPESTVPEGFQPDPVNIKFNKIDAASLRENFSDPDAMFLAFKGGRPTVSHGHIDSGTFVFDALGKRWAMELGSENYNIPGHWERKTDGRRWKYYRLRAEGHNTLVVNPSGQNDDQNVEAHSPILRFDDDSENPSGVVDLTPAYKGFGVEKVLRKYELVSKNSERYAMINDTIIPDAAKPADIWWFMHTKGYIDISKDGKAASIKIDDEYLDVELVSPADGKFTLRQAKPLPMSPNPPESRDNKGINKLTVLLEGVDGETTLCVKLTPRYDK